MDKIREEKDFEVWWPSVGQTIGKVAAKLAWMARAARQPERGEAVAYLCDGMRFKVGPTLRYGLGINGLPKELEGQWVALVDATDDKHMRAHPPAADARVAELEAERADSRFLLSLGASKIKRLEHDVSELKAEILRTYNTFTKVGSYELAIERMLPVSEEVGATLDVLEKQRDKYAEQNAALEAQLAASREREGRLREALEHLHHNAKKSGANMGLALDVAEEALKQYKEKKHG